MLRKSPVWLDAMVRAIHRAREPRSVRGDHRRSLGFAEAGAIHGRLDGDLGYLNIRGSRERCASILGASSAGALALLQHAAVALFGRRIHPSSALLAVLLHHLGEPPPSVVGRARR